MKVTGITCASLLLVAACNSRHEPAAGSGSGQNAGSPTRSQGASGAPSVPPATVVAAPAEAKELALPPGSAVVDIAVWPTGPDAVVLMRDAAGAGRIAGWHAGEASTTTMLELPAGFDPAGITVHPRQPVIFVTGKVGDSAQILAVVKDDSGWRPHVIYRTSRQLGRILVGPERFGTTEGSRYRLFFEATGADGGRATRTITESGTVEYQVLGPTSSLVDLPGMETQQYGEDAIVPSALPIAFHPAGDMLLWQDARGCFHYRRYEGWAWGASKEMPAVPCGGSLSVTPNGTGLLHWRHDQPGLAVTVDYGRGESQQAGSYTFLIPPISTPDGKGVIGAVAKGGTTDLVYVPVAVPLADVANAWMFLGNRGDAESFTRNAGLFRPQKADQIYNLYDQERYTCASAGASVTTPFLVTTDVFWYLFGIAYEGMFILQERRQAVPAFWAFVAAADTALAKSAPRSQWAMAFSAVDEVHGTPHSAEALHIARDSTMLSSSVFPKGKFDFGELKPRGHYTSSKEMQSYFRAVHYLTMLNNGLSASPLAALPADVQRKAMQWISVYTPYIAPPRGPLVWKDAAAELPAYARHPRDSAMIFPLAWGFDNEVMLSTVFQLGWPAAEQIGVAGVVTSQRLLPSGLDIGAAHGSQLARSLLGPDLARFARLGPVLDALHARRPVGAHGNLYDGWLAALALEWADTATFPGVPPGSPIWPTKRLQTALTSWATLREATILVNERPESNAESGEGGFEETLDADPPRGYVEPSPKTLEGIASLFDDLAATVKAAPPPAGDSRGSENDQLVEGVEKRLAESAVNVRRFETMAEKELEGKALADSEYEQIQSIGGTIEESSLLYQSLNQKDKGITIPEPMMKVADVAADPFDTALLEVAVGRPLEWDQIVPFFGRREIVKGSVYSYYEFISPKPYDNERWRREVDTTARPPWIQPLISPNARSCTGTNPF